MHKHCTLPIPAECSGVSRGPLQCCAQLCRAKAAAGSLCIDSLSSAPAPTHIGCVGGIRGTAFSLALSRDISFGAQVKKLPLFPQPTFPAFRARLRQKQMQGPLQLRTSVPNYRLDLSAAISTPAMSSLTPSLPAFLPSHLVVPSSLKETSRLLLRSSFWGKSPFPRVAECTTSILPLLQPCLQGAPSPPGNPRGWPRGLLRWSYNCNLKVT